MLLKATVTYIAELRHNKVTAAAIQQHNYIAAVTHWGCIKSKHNHDHTATLT